MNEEEWNLWEAAWEAAKHEAWIEYQTMKTKSMELLENEHDIIDRLELRSELMRDE